MEKILKNKKPWKNRNLTFSDSMNRIAKTYFAEKYHTRYNGSNFANRLLFYIVSVIG
jgi:hypothetical protein